MTASASRLAVAMAGAALLAGCAAIPTAPPPLPPTFIPEIEPSSEPGSSYVSADGFDAVEHVAIRLRVETCTGYSNGSGWVLDENTVVTNRHVVEGATHIELSTYDGRDYVATTSVLAGFADLALVHTDDVFGEFAVIADEEPQLGEKLRVVGYPQGDRLTTTAGPFRDVVPDDLGTGQDDVFEIQAESHPGNSGSPVVNADGEVVGVLYASNDDDFSWAVSHESLEKFLADDALHQPNLTECDY